VGKPRHVLQSRHVDAERDNNNSVGFKIDKNTLTIAEASAASGALPGMR
jgi:hypothetical protein